VFIGQYTGRLSLAAIATRGEGRGGGLAKTLGPFSLVGLGIGCIIGAGIFVLTGLAARDYAGPGLVLSFTFAGIGCALAALCYAEFASTVPVAGSAYTYAYATLGELFAWIIGWDLVLEYVVASSTVAHGWSHYLDSFLNLFGVAIPPALITEIAFDPVLPHDRLTLYRHSTAGPETKTLLVYDEPFWRADGFSGQSAGPQSASEVTLDASPASGKPGVIASFTFGPVAERVDALDADERRRLVLAEMVERFGPRAGAPSQFIETAWWKEEWTRGCSMAHWSPGILTQYGALLRLPFGRIHWAGTETATVSYGAIDGAVRSGERAAATILGDATTEVRSAGCGRWRCRC
jgi:hypothetical protein